MPDTPSSNPTSIQSGPGNPSGDIQNQTEQAPVSGRRQAFDDVLKPLTQEELASPGTQKLVLYMLQQAQASADQFEGYVERFHEADKRAAVLEEQLENRIRMDRTVEIAIITGTSFGGALIGVGTYFWGKTPPDVVAGWIAVTLGIGFILGSIAVKIAKR